VPKYNKAINSFSSGELGPKTRARFDIDEYSQGLDTLSNMVLYKSGGAVRRPGSRFVAEIDSALLPATIPLVGMYPFIFSQDEAYTIIIGPDNNTPDNAVKVFKRDGASGIVDYKTGVTDYFLLPNFPAELDPLGFQYAQSGDVMYFVHNSGTYPPFVIKRTSQDNFEVQHIWGLGEPFDAVLTNNYEIPNIDEEKLLYFDSATVNPYIRQKLPSTRTVFSCDSAGTAIDTVFKQTDVGSIWRCTKSAAFKECVFYIQSVAVNLESATILVLVGIDTTQAGVGNRDDNWRRPEWSDEKGWPRTISFFQQRLIFGGSTTKPDTLWISKVNNFKNFMSDKLDQDITNNDSALNHFGAITNADGFNANIASTEVNDINWLSADTDLMVGTTGVEYAVSPINGAFGQETINVKPKSSYGSKPTQAFKGGLGIIYVSRDGKRVRRFKFSLDTGEQSNIDLTTLNADIVYHSPGSAATTVDTQFKSIVVRQIAWQESRSTMWFITSNKALIGFTIDQKSGVAGWHKHVIAPIGGDQAEILGVIVLPNEDNTYMDVWIAVSRTILARKIVSLEKMGDDFEHELLLNNSPDENDHPFYLDGSVRFTAAEASASRTFDATNIDHTTEDTVTFKTSHKYHQGQEVQLTTTSLLPGGLSLSTNYYLIVEDHRILRFAATPADAATGKTVRIDLLSGGTGTHSIDPTAISTLSTWSGLDHLTTALVRVIEDGTEVGRQVSTPLVSITGIGATITTDAVSEVIVGLSYTSLLKTLPLDIEDQKGSSRGNITRIDRADLMFYKTYSGQFGSDENDLEEIEVESTPLTGDKVLDFPASPDRLGQVIIKTDSALPLSLLGLTLRGQHNEG